MRGGIRTAAVGVATLAVVGFAGCGDETNNTTVNASCGAGTRLDPATNTCVAIDGPDASAGAGGGASGTGGGSGSGGDGGDAGTGGNAGLAGDAAPGDAGDDAGSVWVDDECGESMDVIANGDATCQTMPFLTAGICAQSLPGTEPLAPLTKAMLDPYSMLVRTPRLPGVDPACGTGCAGPGTVARIEIPIDIPDADDDPSIIRVRHIGHKPYGEPGEPNTMAPWRIIWHRTHLPEDLACSTPPVQEKTYDIRETAITLYIETDDPNAPAREFELMYCPDKTSGRCAQW